MNGFETLSKTKSNDQNIPIISLLSQDKLNLALNYLPRRAFDYVLKSETAPIRLQHNKQDFKLSKNGNQT